MLLDSISCCIQRLVSGRCRVDRLIIPQSFPTLSDDVSPPLLLIDTFLLYLPYATANTGGGVGPLLKLLVLDITCCSYTGDILYYICATVKYTTFTSAIWSPHDRFAKVYF